jgi:alpha-1,6-mannosyltransferase
MRLLLLLGLGLAGLTAAGLPLGLPLDMSAEDLPRVQVLVALMMAAAALYFLAVRLVLRGTWPRQTLWVILAVAVLLRALPLAVPPFLSSDIYRYVWDGRVQAAGINPYLYIPADPALAALRDTTIYPHINRADYARTIYPPAAQLVFAAVARIWGSVTAMRLVMVGFEVLGVVCALLLLPLAGLPRERILIYAWNPLPVWSIASDGHVDALVVGLVGLALLLRAKRRDGVAGAILATAAMAKFFPLVLAPAFLRGGRFWRPAVAGAAVIIVGYAIYLSAGLNVLGFLPSYGSEEGLARGSGIWALAGLGLIAPLPAHAVAIYAAIATAALVALAVAILRRPAPANDVQALCRDTALLAAVAMVAASPHYHWYFAWLALPAVLAPSRAVLWLATVPLLLIIGPIPGDQFLWRALVYGPALVLALADHRHALSPSIQAAGDIACPLRSP